MAKRQIVLPDSADVALGYTHVDCGIERSELILLALLEFIPTVSTNPLTLEIIRSLKADARDIEHLKERAKGAIAV